MDFHDLYPQLINGTGNPDILDALWTDLSEQLNAMHVGPKRTSMEWKRAFQHYKNLTRCKEREIRKHDPHSGPSRELNELEERVLAMFDGRGRAKKLVLASQKPVTIQLESKSLNGSDAADAAPPADIKMETSPVVRPTLKRINLVPIRSLTQTTAKNDGYAVVAKQLGVVAVKLAELAASNNRLADALIEQNRDQRLIIQTLLQKLCREDV